MRLPKVFIASPLFNPQQMLVIDGIEQLLHSRQLEYYSARHDSESHVPKGDDKKKPEAWNGVFRNNEEGLRDCDIMIAVLSYALAPDCMMGTGEMINFSHQKNLPTQVVMNSFKPLELPDSGTVWEMGYFRALDKIVIGFHPEKRGDHLNLMLTHGCDGLISGWDNLSKFIGSMNPVMSCGERLQNRMHEVGPLQAQVMYTIACHFDWEAIELWGAQNDE